MCKTRSIHPCGFHPVAVGCQGRAYFLDIAIGVGFDDPDPDLEVGGEVDLVLVADDFVEPEGKGTVVLPDHPEPYDRFQGLARFGLVHAPALGNGYYPCLGIGDAELAFPELAAVGRLAKGGMTKKAGKKKEKEFLHRNGIINNRYSIIQYTIFNVPPGQMPFSLIIEY